MFDIILNYNVRNATPLILNRFDRFFTLVNLTGQTSFYWFKGVTWSITERMLHAQICLRARIRPQIHSSAWLNRDNIDAISRNFVNF